MSLVQTRHDRKRGCGWRKSGGLYLVATGIPSACGKLPIPMKSCPCCGGGIKPTRGWTWIDGDQILESRKGQCEFRDDGACARCPLSDAMFDCVGRVGLIWVGGSFYKKPSDWTKEAAEMGVSRRIPHVPKDFVAGKTWVWVAHRKAIDEPCPHCRDSVKKALTEGAHAPCAFCDDTGTLYTPGVFHLFKPTAVEYITKGNETEEELESLIKRGITPVKVERVEEKEPSLIED